VGVSNYGPTLLRRCHARLAAQGVPLASNQINYSLLYRGSSDDLAHGVGPQATVDAGQALGVKTLAYMPLAMGLLTGKYSDDAARSRSTRPDAETRCVLERLKEMRTQKSNSRFAPASHRRHRHVLQYIYIYIYITRDLEAYGLSVAPVVAALRAVGARRGVGPTEVALNWVLAKGALPVVGVRTAHHLSSVHRALGWRLTPLEVAALEGAADAAGVAFEGAGKKRASEKFVGYGVEKWLLD
jgi:pyridoxine 4-dehydrogenase